MVQINFAQKEIQCKIVYYGPGMSGKTTNLELVHSKVPSESRGELTSIATTGERTLYFDYMPLDLGQIAGIRTKFQLYTVPGQVYYKSTRRLVLQGVDGIVFVADSSRAKLKENQESMTDLEENLRDMGKGLGDVPIVIQYNKRDLPDAMSLEELEKEVNPHGFPHFEAMANKGEGVFPTLKGLAGKVLESVNSSGIATARAKAPPRAAPATGETAVNGHVTTRAAIRAPAPMNAASPSGAGAGVSTRTAPRGTAQATANAGSYSPPRSGSATAVAPQRNGSAAPPPSGPGQPASHRPPGATVPRSLQDRVVAVSGLGRRNGMVKFLPLMALGALIAGAVVYLLSRT